MKHLFKKAACLSLLSLSCMTLFSDELVKQGLYQQINPELLKKVKVDTPSESDQHIINACRSLSEFGTEYPAASFENWQAIQSVKMLTDILPMYARNITMFGRVGLAVKMAQMTDDFTSLQVKQDILKYFQNNPDVVQKLLKVLHYSKEAELAFLNLFRQMNQEEQAGRDTALQAVYFSTPKFSKLNENKAVLEATTRLKMLQLTLPLIGILAAPTVMNYFQDVSADNKITKFSNAVVSSLQNFPKLPGQTVDMFTPMMGKGGAIAYTGFLYGLNIFNFYTYAKGVKAAFDIVHTQQKELIAVGHLIKSMRVMSDIFQNDDQLASLMPTEHQKLSELFNSKSSQISADLKHLMEELISSSFQGDDSYLLSQQGKILATHHLLNRIKGELIPYIEAYGQVDANLAIFTLCEEFKNHPRVTFCLPEFIHADCPVLEVSGFWHPQINPDYVITNDLSMNEHTANLIITGPNAGGKTTSLMSLIINIIFAQSFGIAPSGSLRMTPFAKIHSYLDITTNLQEGLSLFAAEVDRSKKLKQSITSCTSGQKTFTIIDELFSGTAPDVASNLGLKFAEQLGNVKHSMTIITTHFPAMTQLEKQTKRFENYKVADASVAADGSISYPFKLVKGASTQNIAQQMLEHEGIF